jgi:hypothetical protein
MTFFQHDSILLAENLGIGISGLPAIIVLGMSVCYLPGKVRMADTTFSRFGYPVHSSENRISGVRCLVSGPGCPEFSTCQEWFHYSTQR